MNATVARFQRLPSNARGAIWMIISAVLFTLMTTLIKFLGENYPAAVQNLYRQAAGLLVLAPVILRNPKEAFKTTRFGLILFRSSAGTISTILAFYCYQKMSLAEANVLSFTRILWMVPLAAFVLREPVGPRRVAATLVGFLGVLLIVRPSGHTHFTWAAGAGLVAAFLVSFTVTGLKVVTRDHSVTTLMVWSASLGVVFSIPPALVVWQWPTTSDLFLLALMGGLGTLTQWSYIKGIAVGEAAAMAPLDYVRLPLALLVGYVLFSDVPTERTLLGAAVIIASTLYITIRELRLGVAKPEPAERT